MYLLFSEVVKGRFRRGKVNVEGFKKYLKDRNVTNKEMGELLFMDHRNFKRRLDKGNFSIDEVAEMYLYLDMSVKDFFEIFMTGF